jgi:hypothetical protein
MHVRFYQVLAHKYKVRPILALVYKQHCAVVVTEHLCWCLVVNYSVLNIDAAASFLSLLLASSAVKPSSSIIQYKQLLGSAHAAASSTSTPALQLQQSA